MSELNRFDRVAPVYDRLKRFVFGRAIRRSEICFLQSVKPDGRVLILGGGSGEMLRVLLERKPDCKVWYVEASSKMLMLARKNAANHESQVIFIHGTEDSLDTDSQFDAIITNFFLDLFSEKKVSALCKGMHKRLANDGIWIITDFVDGARAWQRFLLWLMYAFFRATTGIRAHNLPAWECAVSSNGFFEKKSRMFYWEFIKGSLWMKIPSESVDGKRTI